MSSELRKEEVSKHTTSNNTSNVDNKLLQDFLGKVMSDLGGLIALFWYMLVISWDCTKQWWKHKEGDQ
jgi:hypothetical protein